MSDTITTVLIVDDSPSARELLTYIINQDPNLEVIGCVENGEKALEFLKFRKPDVITMDIIMPKMDGFETTRRIMAATPIPILIISSSYNPEDVSKSFQAIDAGSLGILKKPMGPTDPEFPIISKKIRETIAGIAGVKLVARRHRALHVQEKPPVTTPIEVVAIGASLGGPQALKVILSQLPASYPLPIFVVQHISEGFVGGFVDWLNETTPLNVKLAEQGYYAQAGDVLIAPDHFHMEIGASRRVTLIRGAPLESICPSIGKLFQSIAKTYGPRSAGLLLTGMGRDGVDELLEMKNRGAITIAQDEEGCTMFGMPREAIAAQAVKHVVPLGGISGMLLQLAASTPLARSE